jgi:hypothetical protein
MMMAKRNNRNSGSWPMLSSLIFFCVVVLGRQQQQVAFAAATDHPLAPYAVSLTDATFEHQTQASTGQTTGHWLIQFFDESIVLPTGEQYEEDEWLESNVVIASVNLALNPSLRKRFASHLTAASDSNNNCAATWIYLHNKAGLTTMSGTSSWQDLKRHCDAPGVGTTIPPPVLTMSSTTSANAADPTKQWGDFLFELFHKNAVFSCLAFGVLGIRVLVWLVKTYAGDNAHKRVRLHHDKFQTTKKRQ